MNAFSVLLGFLLGLVFGGGATYLVIFKFRQKQTETNQTSVQQAKTAFSVEAATDFKSLSMKVLAPITEQLAKTAGSKLAGILWENEGLKELWGGEKAVTDVRGYLKK